LFINENSVINNSIIGLTDSSLNGINNLVGLDPLLLPLNFYQGSAQQYMRWPMVKALPSITLMT